MINISARMRALLAIFLLTLASPALAQTPGTLNLSGPSTGGPVVTTATINGAVNAQLGAKADAANPAVSGNMTVGGNLVVNGTFTGAGASFLPLGGGTLTGGLSGTTGTFIAGATIGSNTFSGVSQTINGVAGGTRWTRWQTAGSLRWQMGPSGAEAGSNAGADLVFGAFDDTGTNLARGMTLTRASGGILQTANTTWGAASVGALQANQTFSGTTSLSTAAFNQLSITENVDATGAANGVQGLTVIVNQNGGKSSRSAVSATVNQIAAPPGGSDPLFSTAGMVSDARANFNVGGTAPTIGSAKGFVFGANPSAHIFGAATNFVSPIGMEVNVVAGTGTTFVRKVGIQIVSPSNDAAAGSAGVDAHLLMFTNGGAKYDYGILLGDEQGEGPVKTTGTLIGTRPYSNSTVLSVGTVGWDVDFLPTIATKGLIRGNGFQVDGTGTAYIGFGAIKPDATGLFIDTGIKRAATATVATGGTGWTAVCDVDDDQGNIWTIGVSGGAITSATIKRAAQTTTAPAVTTINPQWFQPAATGATLNVTYGTGTTLTLQPTAGGILKVGTGLMSANGAVATTMTSLGPTGSHTTIQEWMTVTNAAGTVRYIPAY